MFGNVDEYLAQAGIPTVEVANDTSKRLYRLMYSQFARTMGQAGNSANHDYYETYTNMCPFIYCGPSDLDVDANIGDVSTWKTGPVDFIWDCNENLWTTFKIHHHLDNTMAQGGVAFAYFFR